MLIAIEALNFPICNIELGEYTFKQFKNNDVNRWFSKKKWNLSKTEKRESQNSKKLKETLSGSWFFQENKSSMLVI